MDWICEDDLVYKKKKKQLRGKRKLFLTWISSLFMLNRRALQSQEGTSGREAHCRAGYGLSCLKWGCGVWVLASAVSSASEKMADLTLLQGFYVYRSLFWICTEKGNC